MPRRTFWLVTGVAIGAGSSLWMEHKVRRTFQEAAARLHPDALVSEVGRSARDAAAGAGDRVRDAFSSGRNEMQRREEELWAELAARGASAAASPSSQPNAATAAEPAPTPEERSGPRRHRGVRRPSWATRGFTSHAAP
jgi:hypothetical protein